MALPNSILQYGLRSAQPAAATSNNGQLYRVTDEGNIVEQSNGSSWDSFGGPSNPSLIQTATVSITNAAMLTLPTTPIELVAAPGSGVLLLYFGTLLVSDFTAGAYTGLTNGDYLYIGYNSVETISSYLADDSALSPALAELTAFVSASARMTWLSPYQRAAEAWGTLANAYTQANAVNKNLTLAGVVSLGNFGGGNAGNTLTAITFYQAITL